MQFYDDLWKAELNSFVNEFKDVTQGNDEGLDRYFFVERPLLYSAFIVRKLIEDNGVTDVVKDAWLEVGSHASTRNGEPIFLEVLAGPLEIHDHFDLAQRNLIRISYRDLASEIIHCDGIVWKSDVDALGSFMVFSYRNALSRLVDVTVEQYIGMLERVISDQPTQWRIEKDLRTGRLTRHAI